MYRFMDQAQLIKKALDEGKLGNFFRLIVLENASEAMNTMLPVHGEVHGKVRAAVPD